jgi:DNA-binding transcriptional LysR family regulator
MDIKQLEYVLAIANAGTLGRAANRVGLTQQALSKSLSRFESACGGKLFERTSRGMVLTRLGQTVCEHARDVIASANRLNIAVADEVDLERGRLSIGLSPIAATNHLGQIVTDFMATRPDLRIDIEAGIDRDFIRALNLGVLDLAIGTNATSTGDTIVSEPLGHEVWGVAGRHEHPLLAKCDSLSELMNASWVVGRNTELLDEKIEETFRTAQISQPRPGIMTTSVLFAMSAIKHGDYLSILPRSLCEGADGMIWRDLSAGEWRTPIYLMRRKRAHLNLPAQQLIDAMTSGN